MIEIDLAGLETNGLESGFYDIQLTNWRTEKLSKAITVEVVSHTQCHLGVACARVN